MSEFIAEITSVLATPTQTGLCNEVVTVHGMRVRHVFAWAVGMGSLHRKALYEQAFLPLPEWVMLEHPFHRMQLCGIAIKFRRPLPECPPPSRAGFWRERLEPGCAQGGNEGRD